MAKKLYVGGLAYSTTEDSLKEAFAQAGTVETATIIIDKMSGRSKGFGFVEMASEEEAQKAIELFDGKGNEIALAVAQAGADWMTTEFVPFEAVITFILPTTSAGTLVLEKDNPSDLPENEEKMYVPVKFQ